ncbi:MAG: hypothetical protein M1818_007254 [Claussenomyces sp. TS43310]|nr:MAG: hypothetical protein M1818_007254 [Claussenomyces sp. TS43310]
MSEEHYEAALSLIDEAHAQDPNIAIVNGKDVPYELHYAQRCTHYLRLRSPRASPVLRIAVRAQHFRRWEIPRSSYPATKTGYLQWRTFLKRRQGDLVQAICVGCNVPPEQCEAIAALIRKEDLKANAETQALEDVACLVFLDDRFAAFDGEHDEDKIVDILRKTWGKMSGEGRMLALGLDLSNRARAMMAKALQADVGERGDEKLD